jgi:hypothetical protein
MTAACTVCTRPVGDGARLCPGCTGRLERDLGDLATLADELETTRARQSRTGGQATGIVVRSADTPLPWNDKASDAAALLRSTVVAWVRVAVDDLGVRCPRDTMQSMAGTLLAALPRLRHHDAADALLDEIDHVTGLARQVIDRRPDRTYAGPCRADVDEHDDQGPSCCVEDLYARPGSSIVVCRRCHAEHDAAARRDWLLRIAENQLVTVAELAAMLGTGERPFSRHTINSWIRRGRLVQHGEHEPALYRVGDAVTLVYGMRRSA